MSAMLSTIGDRADDERVGRLEKKRGSAKTFVYAGQERLRAHRELERRDQREREVEDPDDEDDPGPRRADPALASRRMTRWSRCPRAAVRRWRPVLPMPCCSSSLPPLGSSLEPGVDRDRDAHDAHHPHGHRIAESELWSTSPLIWAPISERHQVDRPPVSW